MLGNTFNGMLNASEAYFCILTQLQV